jgi:hypothetical protein
MNKERNELITKKLGYEAMLYCIKAYWENSGSNDLTDILSDGEYWKGTDEPLILLFGNIGQKQLIK